MNPNWNCPHCQALIQEQDVNVATDVALCRSCGKVSPFSSLVSMRDLDQVDVSVMPKGFREEQSMRGERVLRYKRLSPALLFLLPFTCVWAGGSMTGIYGTQIMSGEFNWFQSLFGLPFLVGSIAMVSAVIFMLFGSWRFVVHEGELKVIAGVGPLVWTRRLPYHGGTVLREQSGKWTRNHQQVWEIEAQTDHEKLKFFGGQNEDTRQFVMAWLRQAMKG